MAKGTTMKITASKVKQNNPIAGVVAFILALLIISPLVYCVLTSFLTEQEIFQLKVIPTSLNIENYQKALDQAPLFQFILNSIIVSCSCMALQLITGSMAGYAFGCLKFKGQNAIFKIFLATMMIPGNAIIISNYLTVSGWGLLKQPYTLWPLILPYMTSAFCVFNMRQAYKSLPSELTAATASSISSAWPCR